ncbi:MAG: hypothetical protein KAW92_06410 [Candidatus Cloacimonetes bacterium]|nr:hypothetical protein [Candidatus Cloacimonadota bacterium]
MNKEEYIFKFPSFIRIFSIIFAILALVWSVYYIIFEINEATQWFKKISPFIVTFLVIHVLYKNLFGVNSIHIHEKYLQVKFILRKNICINWNIIKKLEFSIKLHKSIILTYNENDNEKRVIIPRGIRDIISALNLIAERSPNLELDDFMSSIISTNSTKE